MHFFLAVLLLSFSAFYLASYRPSFTGFTAFSGGGSNQASMWVWDSTDSEGGGLDINSLENLTFYANYTNTSSKLPVNGTGIYCEFRTNMSGLAGPTNMTYNATASLYQYTKNVTRKGYYSWNVTCEGTALSYEDLTAYDNFTVTNTYPSISQKPLPAKMCYEDSNCTFNLSAYSSDPDSNDVINYSRSADTYFSPFAMGSQTGLINFNATTSTQAQSNYSMILLVMDSDSASDSVSQDYTIIAVNDNPEITLCSNTTAVEDRLYTCDIDATDEENDIPYNFTTNASIFTINSTTGLVNFTPSNSHVGTHDINVSVEDSRGGIATTLMTLTVYGTNDGPIITYACNNETNATEDLEFICWLNASDVDSEDNLTFSTNTTWFSINTSSQRLVNGNVSSKVNFTANDTAVGNHTIYITVTDTSNAQNTTTFNFAVANVPDYPMFDSIKNMTAYAYTNFTKKVNATDKDTYTQMGDTIYYYSNSTFFTINPNSGIISFSPGNNDTGEYGIRFTLNDTYGMENTTVINFTIAGNLPPSLANASMINTTSVEGHVYNYNLSLNITEPNGEAFNCTDNTTLFNITAACIINFSATDSQVGNHTVEISLTDVRGALNVTSMTFEILNENDAPSFSNISNMSAWEDTLYTYDIDASDSDLNVPNSTENLTFYSNFTLTSINPSTGLISFTPTVSQLGEYCVNVSVYDTSSAYDQEIINITVSGMNDNPVLGYIGDQNAIEDILFTKTLQASDEENDSLTFSCNTSWMTINAVNSTAAIFNFTPAGSRVGNHTVNVTVRDNTTGKDWEIVNFDINGTNDAPNITFWEWDNSTSKSNNTATGTNRTSFTARENTTLTFKHVSSDADGDTLSYYWYFDNAQNATTANWTYWLNSSCNGVHNVTLNVTDPSKASDWMRWEVNVSNVNSAPEFYKNISNQTWSEDSWNQNIDLDDYFRDSDGDTLTFTHNGTSSISVSINNETHLVTMIPYTDWYGTEYIDFTANDSSSNVTSNTVTLNVTPVTNENVVYVTVPTSSSGGSVVQVSTTIKVASLKIEVESFREIQSYDLVDIGVLFKNTGEVDIGNISLSTLSTSWDIEASLDIASVQKIAVNKSQAATLRLKTYNLTQKRYDLYVFANASSPGLNASSTIYLRVYYVNQTSIEAIIKFAKDLFEENPECMELWELILEAEGKLKSGLNQEAMELTKKAIDNCRDILSRDFEGVPVSREKPPEQVKYDPLIIGILLLSIFIVVSILLMLALKGKIIKKKKEPEEAGTGLERPAYA